MGTIDIDYQFRGSRITAFTDTCLLLVAFQNGITEPILIGAVRMIIQLFFIGVYLRFLLSGIILY